MFQIKIRQAETAFKEGRLEEASQLVLNPQVFEHKSGKLLITKLIDALTKRAQSHLDAKRLQNARLDCRLAKRLGGNQETLADVESQVEQAIHNNESTKRRANELLAAADRELRRGEIKIGQQVLEQLPADDSNAVRLSDRIAIHQEEVESARERARQAVTGNDIAEAVSALQRLKKLSPEHPDLPRLIADLINPIAKGIESDLNEGRLDRAERSLVQVQTFAIKNTRLQELSDILNRATRIASKLAAGRFEDATHDLRRFKTMLPSAKWLARLADQAERIVSDIRDLQSSPFSLLEDADATGVFIHRNQEPKQNHEPALGFVQKAHPLAARFDSEDAMLSSVGKLPGHQRWLLQIDGVGAVLLIGGDHVSIGNSLKSKRVDVPLVGFDSGGLGAGDVVVSRDRGDYTLQCANRTRINGRDYARKLLVSGDSLEFGRRCRVKFDKPNAAAGSAVLRLTGAKLPRPDVRHVILFDDSIVIGGPNGHIDAPGLSEPLVIFHRDGELWIRQGLQTRSRRSDGAASPKQRLAVNESVEVAGTRIAINEFSQF